MGSLIETFHINTNLLIAQSINFTIVFFVLYYLALKPLMKVMDQRSSKIEKSIKDAEKIEKNLARTEEEYNKKLGEAKKEANKIIEKARQQAEDKKQEIIKKAKEEIGQIINQEKAKMRAERAQTLKEIKLEAADLALAAAEKLLEREIDARKDKELIKKIINRL